MLLGNKLLECFVGDEILTLREIADRTGYGDSTVAEYMSMLSKGMHIHRVGRGRYSLYPHKNLVFTLKDEVLAVARETSFVTSNHLRKRTGLNAAGVNNCLKQLVKEGRIHKIRRGCYSADHPSRGPAHVAPARV